MSDGTTVPADRTASATAAATLLPHELDLARLIVAALSLEVAPDSIPPDAPLFNGGLGLDSIDALELSLLVSKVYGVKLRSDDERNHRIFASLRTLSAHIEKQRAETLRAP